MYSLHLLLVVFIFFDMPISCKDLEFSKREEIYVLAFTYGIDYTALYEKYATDTHGRSDITVCGRFIF